VWAGECVGAEMVKIATVPGGEVNEALTLLVGVGQLEAEAARPPALGVMVHPAGRACSQCETCSGFKVF